MGDDGSACATFAVGTSDVRGGPGVHPRPSIHAGKVPPRMCTSSREYSGPCTVGCMVTATLTHNSALARLGHALSDETRTRILLALREAPAYPSDLAQALGVSRQVMSNQLACLRGCGLVESIPDGRRTWYRLADEHLAHALNDLLKLVLVVDPDCCGPDCGCAA